MMEGIRGSGRRSSARRAVALFFSLSLSLAASLPTSAQTFVTPSSNTNIIGVTPNPANIPDLGLKQQQEPSCVVRPNNPSFIFCAYNDLRAADLADVQGDSWMGVSMSNDFGQTWFSRLAPGFRGDTSNSLQMGFAADPSVIAIPGDFLKLPEGSTTFERSPGGLAILNYIAAFRDSDAGVFAIQRWVEFPKEDQDFWKPEDQIYTIADGSEGRFIDKPAFYYLVDDPSQQGTITEDIFVEGEASPIKVETPTGTLIAVAAIFTGNGGGSKIVMWKSYDNGKTWPDRQKISEEQNEVTGVSIAAKGQDFVVVYRRKGDSNEPDAILSAICSNTGNQRCSKGEVVYEICAFDQPASGTTFRTFSFPWAASDGDRFWAFAADRNPGGACTASPTVPGFFEGKPRIVAMSSADGRNWVGAPGATGEPFEIAPRVDGFQAIPVALGTKGRVDVAWYDTFREEDIGLPDGPNDLFINDYVDANGTARVWRKADVWMTRLDTRKPGADCSGGPNAGCLPAIETPVRVSQYETVADSIGQVFDIEGHLTGMPLYGSGTLAFKGDYIAMATRPLRKAATGKWLPNYLPEQSSDLATYTDQEDIFVAWGDNRDVRADSYPVIVNGEGNTPNLVPDPSNQMPYSPPGNSAAAALLDDDGTDDAGDPVAYSLPGELVAQDEPDDGPSQPARADIQSCEIGDYSRARDANVYGSLVRDEASLIAPTASKPLGTIQRMYPLVMNNVDAVAPRDFCLRIENQPFDYPASATSEGNGLASFYQLPSKAPFQQGDARALLDVRVPAGSTASRAVYITTNRVDSIVTVNAYDGACPTDTNPGLGALVSSVDLSNGNLVNPEFCLDPANATSPFCKPVSTTETHDITFAAPVLQTPVLQTPTFQTPTFQTPTFQTPTFQTPTFQTPTFQTPTFQTPTFQTPTLQSSSLSGDATYTTDTMEAPTLQSDTFGSTATTDPELVYYQDITYPVEAAANVTTTYSADIQVDDELDRASSEVQLIAWTPNVYSTAAQCYAQPAADQQIIAYTQLTDTDLSSLTLPFTISEDQQQPYRGEISFFGQPNKDVAVTVRIWAVGNALATIQSREAARQACLAGLGEDPSQEDIDYCENLGTRGLITFGASAHSCITQDADDKTVQPTPFDCLNNGSEKILEDTIGPVVEFTLDSDTEADGPGGAEVFFTVTATDNVVANPTVNCTAASGDIFGLGLNTVDCTATDGTNTTVETFNINVVDTTAPTLTAPPDLTGVSAVEAEAPYTAVDLGTATANDLYDGAIVPTNNAPPAGFPVGDTTVTWTAEDGEGNIATATQLVTVVDTTAPTFDANPLPSYGPFDAEDQDGYVLNYPLPAASDDVDLSVLVVCAPAPGSKFPLGDTNVECWAEDDTGATPNRSPSSFFNVSVTDQTAPEISAPTTLTVLAASAGGADTTVTADASGNFTVEANLPPPDGAVLTFTPVVTDAVATDPAITCTPASGSTFAEGTTLVECSAFDGVNTSETVSFSVIIEDTTDPVFSVVDGTTYTFEANTAGGAEVDLVNDRGLVATDRGETIYPVCEATPAGGGTPILLPDTLAPGDYNVVCSVDGATTTTISVTVIVDINDLVPPVLNIPGAPSAVATVQADATTGTAIVNVFGPIFPGGESISATDIVDSDVTITCSPPSGTFSVGPHTITCTASDDGPNADGVPNTTTGSFTLVVEDVTPPSLVVPTSSDPTAPDIIKEATSPAGAVVDYTISTSDNADPAPALVCSPASGSTFGFGITTVTCTSEDASGNVSTATFEVLVRDTIDPGINPPADITAEATAPLTTVTLGTATANDAGDADVTITNDAPAAGFPVGITTVTWTATDDAGNAATATQMVTITDTTPPAISADDVSFETVENFGLTPKPSVTVPYLTRSNASATDLVDASPALSCEISNPDADVVDDPTTGSASISAYGTWQVECTATDSAANQSTATFSLSVVFQYGIDLILPKGNIRAGSTVPIDWVYKDTSGNLVDSSAIVPIVRWDGRYDDRDSECSGASTQEELGEDAGSSSIRYSASQLTWQFSWQTPSEPGRYRLVILPPGEIVPGATECILLR